MPALLLYKIIFSIITFIIFLNVKTIRKSESRVLKIGIIAIIISIITSICLFFIRYHYGDMIVIIFSLLILNEFYRLKKLIKNV